MRTRVIFLCIFSLCAIQIFAQKSFDVNFTVSAGALKSFNNVNSGPGKSIAGYLDADVDMIRTQDMYQCDYMNYSQFWQNGNINNSFNPDDSLQYSWLNCNVKIDSITRFGFSPFFRFGITFFYTKDTLFTRPPYDSNHVTFSKFSELCKRTVMHFNQGWVGGFSKNIRYWEIWNEPDGGFWNGDSLSFYKLFREVSDSLKRNYPSLKIGGPGVLSGSVTTKRAWIPEFLKYCKANNVKMDFFSWHLYSQFNPYAIAIWGDYIRTLLDNAGYTSTESIISEMNIDLGQTGNPNLNTPKGAAYIASALISAQFGKIDKILLYRGEGIMNMFYDDSLGTANYTWNGLGLRAYSLLYKNTPNRVEATGSDIITTEQSSKRDTTNFMILAGRSDDSKSCYIMVSNYKSAENSCVINLHNLPWNSTGNISITKNITNAQGDFFTQTTSSMNASSSLSIQLDNITAPFVAILRLTYSGELTSAEEKLHKPTSLSLEQNFPNPFNPETTIQFSLEEKSYVQLTIYDQLGREVAVLFSGEKNSGVHSVTWNAGRFSSGVYFYELKAGIYREMKKLIVVK